MLKAIKQMLKNREWSLAIDTDKGDEVGVVEFRGNVFNALWLVIWMSKF